MKYDMGLNSMEMPACVLEALYKNSLLQEGNISPAKIPVTTAPVPGSATIQYLGKNQQQICILVNYPDEVYLPEEQLNFLINILQACKLNLGDVAIVNKHHHQFDLNALMAQLSCKHLLIFGAGFHEVINEDFVPQIINQCNIITAPVIEQLNNSSHEGKLLKSKLWICLKQLFNI